MTAAQAALLLGVLALATAQPAAARPLTTGFADPLFAAEAPDVRGYWLDRSVDAKAGIVRIALAWAGVAMPAPPANPADPAAPAYDFSRIDAAVRDATARGLEVLITVSSAPGWAEGPGRPPVAKAPPGTWLPDPELFGAFGRAVATRYSGAFRPSGAATPLPRVRYFQAWNEPNIFGHLTPQWDDGRAASAVHYRRLLNAFYAGVKGVRADNLVLTAGTAPFGTRRGGQLIRPLRFWRQLLCLKRSRGGGVAPRPCEDPAQFDIAAHHPITGAPRSRADHRDDATVPDLSRLRRLIREAERSGRALGARRHPLWVTEIWWESNPPDPRGVRVRTQARWIAEALYLIWKHGVRVAVLLQVRDEIASGLAPTDPVQSGVFYADAEAKPSFTAVRFPFVTERHDRRQVTAWGRSPHAGRLRIERRGTGGWRPVGGLEVSAAEVFRTTVRVRGAARVRAVVAGEHSLAWQQRK